MIKLDKMICDFHFAGRILPLLALMIQIVMLRRSTHQELRGVPLANSQIETEALNPTAREERILPIAK